MILTPTFNSLEPLIDLDANWVRPSAWLLMSSVGRVTPPARTALLTSVCQQDVVLALQSAIAALLAISFSQGKRHFSNFNKVQSWLFLLKGVKIIKKEESQKKCLLSVVWRVFAVQIGRDRFLFDDS